MLSFPTFFQSAPCSPKLKSPSMQPQVEITMAALKKQNNAMTQQDELALQ